ncbi:uncharacterized protein N7469_011657 [Penicillium citrinum]|uniref:Uncharacterized protein n=1 Tax=Penicillium citrinum TaxID=5077 RepID=A0A9W9TAA4_PENCI|nr:uncharacterized protein N7469_011657 [Penicillium citrinum]KAJ5215166.1 hypothetical protein N7469_011657 [Penicillium citrinum]
MEAKIVSATHGVKLRSSNDWDYWDSSIQAVAKRHRIWNIIDPDLADTERQEPVREPDELDFEELEDMDKSERVFHMDVYRMKLVNRWWCQSSL